MKPVRAIALTAYLLGVTPALAETTFPTPEAAVDALVAAVAAREPARFDALFGPDYRAFSAGQQADPTLARFRLDRFERALKEFRSLSAEGEDHYTLVVGALGWPFAVPIVRTAGGWQFDGTAGVEELRNRLVGANELNAIATLDAYVAAQHEYALADHDGDGVIEYAERVRSTPGKRDGLHWETDEDDAGAEASPLAALKALADAVLGERDDDAPFLGYRFRVLYGQGPSARAGAYDYRINGHMVAGFAMIAWPADYGDTGVMTLLVNRDGVIYERDLGEHTATIAASIERFDPGEGWLAVDDETHVDEPRAGVDGVDVP
jgi:hypothetical protein